MLLLAISDISDMEVFFYSNQEVIHLVIANSDKLFEKTVKFDPET